MGLRFRKSLNLGKHFRINVSKSGIGFSYGIKGYRHTKLANGRSRNTFSIPNTGISYVSDSKSHHHKSQSKGHGIPVRSNNQSMNENITITNGIGTERTIESAEINSFQDAEYSDIVSYLKRAILYDRISTVLILLGFLFIVNVHKSSRIIGAICLISGILLKIYVIVTSSNCFDYDLDETATQNYEIMTNALLSLNSCQMIWQVLSTTEVTNQKVHAGASNLIKRKPVRFSQYVPFYLKSNVKPVSIRLKNETLYFMLGFVYIIRGFNVGMIPYKDFKYSYGKTKFIESAQVPSDAHVLKQTWKYVNANGTPDKRYKNNVRMTECEYGVIKFSSASGLNVILYTSNSMLAQALTI